MTSLPRPITILLRAALIAFVALFSRGAFAQTPTTTVNANVTQVSPGKEDEPLHAHPSGLLAANVNRQDCVDDNSLRVRLAFTGVPTSSYAFEVWAGPGDCQDAGTRSSTTATCWPLYKATPTTPILNLDLRVRDIVGNRLHPVPTPVTYQQAGSEACDSQTDSTGEKSVTLNFLWMSGTSVANAQTYVVKLDLVGPAAPTGTTLGVDDTRLVVGWKPSVDADTAGFRVFCQEKTATDCTGFGAAPTTTTVTTPLDGGTDPETGLPLDGGTETTTVETDAGSSVVPDAQYECARAGDKTSTQAVVEGKTNGTTYVVGVSAVDRYGNAGPLSPLVCDAPTKTTNFWDAYRSAGGEAGGGCSLGGPSASSWPFALALLVTGAIVSRRLRNKRDA